VIGDLCRALKDGEKQVRLNATISLGRLLDKTSPHGSLRQLVFGYNYQLTPLNHYLGHIFGLIWPGAGRGSSTQSNSPAAGGSGVGGIAGGGVTR
jgi:hypothetical protein